MDFWAQYFCCEVLGVFLEKPKVHDRTKTSEKIAKKFLT